MGVHSGGSQPQLCQGLQNSRRSRSPWFSGRHHSFQFNSGPRPYQGYVPQVARSSIGFSPALRLLAEPPFEPLNQASLLDLSIKSVFGSGSLWQKSVEDPCIIHRRETPGIQSIGSASPSESRVSSQESDYGLLTQAYSAPRPPQGGPWCPVRALKFYLHRTNPYRGEMDILFLTTSKPVRVASKQTLSRWIISVIKDSISREELRPAGTHVRAHDLRSQAAAWALYKGPSIQEIMEAQGWSSSSTFQSVYLKDVLIPRAKSASRVLTAASSTSSFSTAPLTGGASSPYRWVPLYCLSSFSILTMGGACFHGGALLHYPSEILVLCGLFLDMLKQGRLLQLQSGKSKAWMGKLT